MVNFKQLQPLPFVNPLSPEDEQLVAELQDNRTTLSVINRLTYRFKRTMDHTEQGQGFVVYVNFDEDFPLVDNKQISQVLRFLQLKGLTSSPTDKPYTYSFSWEHP